MRTPRPWPMVATATLAMSMALSSAAAGSPAKPLTWLKAVEIKMPATQIASCGRRALERARGIHIEAEDIEPGKPGFSFGLPAPAPTGIGGEFFALRPDAVLLRVGLPDDASSDAKTSAQDSLVKLSVAVIIECPAKPTAP